MYVMINKDIQKCSVETFFYEQPDFYDTVNDKCVHKIESSGDQTKVDACKTKTVEADCNAEDYCQWQVKFETDLCF